MRSSIVAALAYAVWRATADASSSVALAVVMIDAIGERARANDVEVDWEGLPVGFMKTVRRWERWRDRLGWMQIDKS